MGHVQSLVRTLEMLQESTADLVASAGQITDEQARGPSLLPGWTRGHLLTHVARNAEGGTRLLGWARTGVPSYEYRSVAARAAAIAEGAGRPAAVLAEDVRATAAAFAEAAAAVPPGAWQHLVTWTTGQQTPAGMIARSRLGEVLIHHVDLDTEYGAGSWPAGFVAEMIGLVAGAFRENPLVPTALRLAATDTGRAYQTGAATADGVAVSGTESDLLAWLLGRSGGAHLAWKGAAGLPRLPSPWTT
jgi:maleylpyruvate isomerase